jgi:repressor LexA
MTERQQLVLEFIRTYIKMKGFPPSYQDIATGLGLRSRSNIHRIVHTLREMKMISIDPHKFRTIKVRAK